MKTILFTGARSGIASAVINRLIDEDYYIYVTVHTVEQLRDVKEKYKNYKNIKCFKLDVNNKKDRDKIKELNIDILVSNAAVGHGGSIINMDLQRLEDNFETNVFSNFKIIQSVIQNMINKDSGTIIIMSSLAAIIPLKFLGSYCATKASINKLTQCLRKEVKLITKNIKIKLIMPGMYYTGFNQVMLENKYPEFKNSVFKSKEKDIRFMEDLFWNTLEYQNLDSISKKVYNAISKNNKKFMYVAPFSQKIGAKLYQIFKW